MFSKDKETKTYYIKQKLKDTVLVRVLVLLIFIVLISE